MEQVFSIGNYTVSTVDNPTDLGDGRSTNYVISNTVTNVDELYISTYVQAVAAAIELDKGEVSIMEEIADNEDEYEVEAVTTH